MNDRPIASSSGIVVVVDVSTGLEKDACSAPSDSSHETIPDKEVDIINTRYEDDEYEYDDGNQETVEALCCYTDPKSGVEYDSKKLAELWNKYNGIKLADGVTPASRKLGRFMETALSSRLPKRVMLQMYVAVTAMDANVPTAEEFLKDLKDAGFTYPTWF